MKHVDSIPFLVEISRIIEVLATQIYQSPMALLRENTQNSYDALLLRQVIDPMLEPAIDIEISPTRIRVADNGIGMTPTELKNHYWRAGASSKNTPEARAAGVVGTFGIGAMANFGIAEGLEVVTESAKTGERTCSRAERSTLSATENCISFESLPPSGEPGTVVTTRLQAGSSLDVAEATTYIREFIVLLPYPVRINGELASQLPSTAVVQPLVESWHTEASECNLGAGFRADIRLGGSVTGEVQLAASNLAMGDHHVRGSLLLRQGVGSLRTFRSGFGLATVTLHSAYQLGGVADLLLLEPTAGREALTTSSMQVLQDWLSRLDEFVSIHIAERPESDANTSFMNWVIKNGRYDLTGNLRAHLLPEAHLALREIKQASATSPQLVYGGADQGVISLASEDRPLLLLARSNPRRQCEISYLRAYCKTEELSDDPQVQSPKPEADWNRAESALAFRLVGILSSDYFVSSRIGYANISHGLPLLVTRKAEPIELWLDPEGQSAKLLLSLYENQYMAFESYAKDFVRNVIFPRISDLVPSSTRQGADAFLRSIQRSREVFEYESADLDSLATIWKDYSDGQITMEEAASRSVSIARKAVQVIDRSSASSIREVLPDVVDNAMSLETIEPSPAGEAHEAIPPIRRLEIPTESKLLTIPSNEPALSGYRCFLSITDRVREDRGDFFFQPHKTSVVWGGQRALFVFEHHSGEFGLYYDIQHQNLISQVSGGGAYPTCTIVLKNRIFIPIPQEIEAAFIPGENERKHLEVRCDILYID